MVDKSFVKNTGDFHPQTQPSNWQEPKEWQAFEDSQLRSMLVRLGTKNPEDYKSRQDMILELDQITEVINDQQPILERRDWNGYEDSELRNMIIRLGTKNPENLITRYEMIVKLDQITKIIGRNKKI